MGRMKQRVLEERHLRREQRRKPRYLEQAIKRAIKKHKYSLQQALRKHWGCRELPWGIDMVDSLPGQTTPCLCATLRLDDGSELRGPPRVTLKETLAELEILTALQRSQGDDALRVEVAQRDADVMTALFLTQLHDPYGGNQ